MNERLRALLARVFRVPPESVSSETVQADIAAWDSQGHLDLMMRFEAEFGLELELHEVLRMRSVREIAAVLAERGAIMAA